MHLLRFRLQDDHSVRTGLLHDGLVYETDGEHALGMHKPDDVRMLTPVSIPPTFRDFMAFEKHVENTRKQFGKEGVQKEWFEAPAFFYCHTGNLIGSNVPLKMPEFTKELDFELEVAVVVSQPGSDISPEEADSFILGFTILNDWTARDIQRREAKVGLGYAKSKDFATSVGPYLVTPDELESRVIENHRGKVYNLEATASVNGEEICRANLKEMHWTFAEMIAYASEGSVVSQGDLIASGTLPGGCMLERGGPYLNVGDVVELTVDRLGTLSNTVVL